MAKTKISEFSATAGSNTDIDSINLAEGCAPSGINDAIRELMAQLKDFQTGAVGDSFNGPVGSTTAGTGAFTTLAASSTTTLSGLTASTALALDASKNVVSVTNTGTGSNVLATSPTFVTPVLGTPSSGTVTNLTGTASININGTVGATTPAAGSFTTVTASGLLDGANFTIGNGGGAYFGLVNDALGRGSANYAIQQGSAGNTVVGAPSGQTVTQAVNDVAITVASSTGLAVTGTLSSTTGSNFATSSGSVGVGTSSPATYGGFSVRRAVTTADTTNCSASFSDAANSTLDIGHTSGLVTINAQGGSLAFNAASSERGRFSSTGLAVTGTLSATGLLDLSAATAGQIKFPATQNASADANTLDDYDQYTAASAACTGAITTAVVWKLTKVGNVVTLVLPATLGAGSAASTIDYGVYLPAKYRTGVTMNWNLPLVKNNDAFVAQPGLLQVGADGLILIYRDATAANFTANAGATSTGIASCSVSWTI